MAVRFLCTFPLPSLSGKYQLFIMAPDKQMPAPTQRACWHMKSLIHSGHNTKHQQQDDGWKLQFKDLYMKIYEQPLHTNTRKKTTHVRPQPGPSDWLLLPACCILVRSMCSTYVWIICDARWQENRKCEKNGRVACKRITVIYNLLNIGPLRSILWTNVTIRLWDYRAQRTILGLFHIAVYLLLSR